jgi:ABC-type Fe3+-hydroxamate transport system substrate-binding protein
MKPTVILFTVVLAVFLLLAGCTQPATPPATETSTPTPTVTSPDLSPIPTDVMPPDQRVVVSVSRGTLSFNPVIQVEFRGGPGMVLLSTIDAKVTRPDGTIVTGSLREPKIGDILELVGSTARDRVEVTARMKNGNVYRVFDQVLEFRA